MSSYVKPTEDLFRACWIVALCNSALSIVGGFAIFSIIGNMAFEQGKTVEDIASSGTGLAFISIADGIKTFGSGSNAMSVIFFLVLLSLGLDSVYAWAETIVSYIEDVFLKRGKRVVKWKIVLASCTCMFLVGIPYTCRMGNEMFTIVDHYVIAYFLLLSVFLEIVMVNFEFGWRRFLLAVQRSTIGKPGFPEGRKLPYPMFWQFCTVISIPFMTALLFFYSLYADMNQNYDNLPYKLQLVGWVLITTCVVGTFVLSGPNLVGGKGLSTLPDLALEYQALREDIAAQLIATESTDTPGPVPVPTPTQAVTPTPSPAVAPPGAAVQVTVTSAPREASLSRVPEPTRVGSSKAEQQDLKDEMDACRQSRLKEDSGSISWV
eukprot:NODE_3481_length_2029_cov_6.127234.p1 GENE.NODE_3481_length_2029_cov_6.127234~~NODE_3481_length_2029_cov_6.127234.p1  ORF type:complete len:416 (+),score=87.79 NODE_3481_length_2029_cov_6.127234:115-1248(+)